MPVYDQRVRTKLDEVGLFQSRGDRVEMRLEQREQRSVGDVASSDHQEPLGGPRQQVAVSEVSILRDHNPALIVGQLCDPREPSG